MDALGPLPRGTCLSDRVYLQWSYAMSVLEGISIKEKGYRSLRSFGSEWHMYRTSQNRSPGVSDQG